MYAIRSYYGDDVENVSDLAPVESVEALIAYVRSGEKPAAESRVGTEHEKIGLYAEDHAVVPYEGERGIGALLDRLARDGCGTSYNFV